MPTSGRRGRARARFGDAGDRVLLENLQIKKAMGTVIELGDIETIKRVSASIFTIDPNLKIIAKVPTERDKAQLHEFNHELVIDGNSLTRFRHRFYDWGIFLVFSPAGS